MNQHHWRLPDGIDEVLPPDARHLEQLRRDVLDLFHRWGYEYVIPPLIEYLESLLVGSGHDLELQTFRMVDQQSGRMLGIRADMTSQAARMDAHSLRTESTQRLCYAGTVVHANPAGVLESRIPLIVGAELFGASAHDADVEVITLMVETLRCAGIANPVVELGHVGIFRGIATAGGVEPELEDELFRALQRKSAPDIANLLARGGVAGPVAERIRLLPDLLGARSMLDTARSALVGVGGKDEVGVARAIDEVRAVADGLLVRCPDVTVRFDLCELSGYAYHTGTVFAAYDADYGHALARGGRYDAIGARFGRARPATGFDFNLKRLPRAARPDLAAAVRAPRLDDVPQVRRAALWDTIRRLRGEGTRVISALSGEESSPAVCDRELWWSRGSWQVRSIVGG